MSERRGRHCRHRPHRRRSSATRGVALLTVLLVTALVAVIVIGMIDRHRLSIARTRLTVNGAQLQAHALSAESHFRALLQADLEQEGEGEAFDAASDDWYEPTYEPEDDLAEITMRVRDLSGRLNLNATRDPAGRDRLRRLLRALSLDETLADAVADWIDEDQDPSGSGAEDGVYLLRDPPFRAANGAMASVTELRLLPEVDEEVFRTLLPHVAALPSQARRVNVNTATGPVLSALAPGMTPEAAAAWADPEPPWNLPGDLVAREAGFAPELGMMSVRSRFFEVLILVEHGDGAVTLRSVIHRDPETARTTVLARDFARHFETWAMPPADDEEIR